MRKLLLSAAALLTLGGTALADEVPGGGDTAGASVGVGLICNTPEQAERYVTLRAGGAESKPAVDTVNAEARDPRACGVAAIAFTPDKTLSMHAVGQKLMQVMRINVIAGFNGASWQPVTGITQYTVIEAAGDSI